MSLSEEDMKFLEEASKQLGPELSSIEESLVLAGSPEIEQLWNMISDEAGQFSYVLMCEAAPRLATILDSSKELTDEFMSVRDTLILYALTRGYEAGKQC
jgi:hypothetical protein